jgi:hypothetical protein
MRPASEAAEGEAQPREREDLEKSEWIQRLMARARLAQGDAFDALVWIDKVLARLKAEHFRSEFLELRYDIRSVLGDDEASEDIVKREQRARRMWKPPGWTHVSMSGATDASMKT